MAGSGPEINSPSGKTGGFLTAPACRAIWHGTCKRKGMTIDSTFGSSATAPAETRRPRTSRVPRYNAPKPEIISERRNFPFPWRAAVALTLSALSVPALFMIFLYCCERFGDK